MCTGGNRSLFAFFIPEGIHQGQEQSAVSLVQLHGFKNPACLEINHSKLSHHELLTSVQYIIMKCRLMEPPYFAKSLVALAKLTSGKGNEVGLKIMFII